MNFNDSFVSFLDMHHLAQCLSGYKSAAHTPDQKPSAEVSTVTPHGNGMKVIDGLENNTNFQGAPSGTVHGRTSVQHMSTGQTGSDLC